MSTAIQRRRGTTVQHSTFTGLAGEITVDTTLNRLVVHDGATAGGIPVQKARAELDLVHLKGANIASAATVNLAAATGAAVHITGTTTITALGTMAAGTLRFLTFDGILTLTHNATSLILPDAVSIVTVAGATAVMLSEGSGNWRCINYSSPTPTVGGQFIVENTQTSGTDGGTFTTGADRIRVLNTSVVNNIAGASLATNQITLPAGTYRCRASAPGYAVDRHRAWLYDTTGAATLLNGTSESTPDTNPSQTRSFIDGEFTLTVTSALELRHRCETTNAVNGLGVASSLGTEVYSRVVVERIA